MKLILRHLHHQPSESLLELIKAELDSLKGSLQIDEARIHLERRLTGTPPFSVSFHLVTPGPDIMVDAADYTLRAALLKAFASIKSKIGHRHAKRARKAAAPAQITASARRMAPSSSRK